MWWRRKRNTEQLPWYRSPDYQGGMTEAEKRQLDAFRMQKQHPSARGEEVPEEVQSYINRLECELYNHKQDGEFNRALVPSLAGAALLYVSHFGLERSESIWPYVFGPILLIAPWFYYRWKWRKNADEFVPSDPHAPSSTDEQIRQEWELSYVANLRQSEREAARRDRR